MSGLGYVGLTLILTATDGGYEFMGFDTDAGKTAQLNAGHSYLQYFHLRRERNHLITGETLFVA